MKKMDLVRMIRTIVAEEVKRQLPGIVAEMYFRGQGRRALEETFEEELDQRRQTVPRAMENSDEGIYDEGPIGRKNESSIASMLMSSKNPYAALYEGIATPPAPQRSNGGGQSVPEFGVPLGALGIDLAAMRNNLRAAEDEGRMKAEANNPTLRETPEERLQRIKLLRESLDRPA